MFLIILFSFLCGDGWLSTFDYQHSRPLQEQYSILNADEFGLLLHLWHSRLCFLLKNQYFCVTVDFYGIYNVQSYQKI